MKAPDVVLLTAISELLINLSAGWLIAAFAIPFSEASLLTKIGLLTTNIVLATVCLLAGYKLRKGKS